MPVTAHSTDAMAGFHPAVAAWFRAHFPGPTVAQTAAWPAIRAGENCLVAAPTGSGKTLTGFLAVIDALVHEACSPTGLPEQTLVVYVSPLKALSNDIAINLEAPLQGIRDQLAALGLPDLELRSAVRTGDTATAERTRMRRSPPHILVTTPESLYVLLGSESGRAMLASTRTVIVDEIHAVAGAKRGSHLALSLERLESLCQRRLQRIGLSATQKPVADVARLLVGSGLRADDQPSECTIVDIGHSRHRDLALELPPLPLEAILSNDAWETIYDRIAQLCDSHRTVLVFVNTRRMAERATRHLGERLGKEHVAAHHGSLSKEIRLDAEQRLKAGKLKLLVATASLELGIDIGDVDLVCQLGSPHSIAAFLQRVGRAGHQVDATPKGRLFPQSRDDLVECAALLDAVRRGELDRLIQPIAPRDVLAQQLIAELACGDRSEDELFALVTAATPYSTLARADFDGVVRMLADGYTTRRGPGTAFIQRDAVNARLHARRGARLTAITSGGAISDNADYAVVLEPAAQIIGSVHEDFAVESLAGDVFQLGNASYRILKVERDRLRVEDAQGTPPTIPFWIGEAPGRSDELSFAVSRLRETVSGLLDDSPQAAMAWLRDELGLDEEAARQLVDYLARIKQALGVIPSQNTLALERFFDESGGSQLIVHSPFGSRINKAWGLALRKRFCRNFNFELQAAATEDAIILSLSTAHSFPLADVAKFLHSNSAEQVLVQALLDAPLFGVRWRWAAAMALALPRFNGGRKVPPPLQRMKAEDLLASVFPDQVACLENIVGEREVPDHPLVAQTMHDCLREAMDTDGWLALLRRLESGEATIVARDLTAPSPLAAEILGARPYAFLDDAPLEERRTQAVQTRRWSDPDNADDLGRLDADAIATVRDEAWPQARDADELHGVLMDLGFLGADELAAQPLWRGWLDELVAAGRATMIRLGDVCVLVATERVPNVLAILAGASMTPAVCVPAEFAHVEWSCDEALRELLRARLPALGPTSVAALAAPLAIDAGEVEIALLALQGEGYVMQGHFTPGGEQQEWCERHLLARIHRYTLQRLRREIAPVETRDFLRFLFDWQRVSDTTRASGEDALVAILGQLEGWQAPAAAWESELLPARIADYRLDWLDEQCRSGRVVWSRLKPATTSGHGGPVSLRSAPIVLLPRRSLRHWSSLAGALPDPSELSSRASAVRDCLQRNGASFFDELLTDSRLLHSELEDALSELVARGHVNADSYAGLRALLVPPSKRAPTQPRRGRRPSLFGIADAGRWSLLRPAESVVTSTDNGDAIEAIVRCLLRRYGVVCWRLLEREADWLPSWRDLVRVLRRLEARGEIRGGRFVNGLSGEQFALPEAVGLLRSVRQRPHDGSLVCVAATDPLNLAGIISVGERVPAIVGNRILYRDGIAVAALVAGKPQAFIDEAQLPAGWRERLARRGAAAADATPAFRASTEQAIR